MSALTLPMASESTGSLPERREALRAAFARCRAGTLQQFEDIGEADFRRQPHPGFSPVGWHLGHIAYTEALWLLAEAGGEPLPFPELEPVFHVDGLPKAERGNLPSVDEVRDYAGAVRERLWRRLETADLDREERLWCFILQHESQHSETIAFLRQYERGCAPCRPEMRPGDFDSEAMVPVPAGPVSVGAGGPWALDNERPRHVIEIGDFRIGRYPVTQAQFRRFIDAGGYRERRWWSAEGWAWRKAERVEAPLYWRPGAEDHPVCGVSWYEAEAYCRYAGARQPTEFEWEKAAAGAGLDCNHDQTSGGTTPVWAHPAGESMVGARDMLGNVWEWTGSAFTGYPGFAWFPYEGYSRAWFDGRHRVLRGASWASRPWVVRATMRNWYTPDTRQILAGFRIARDGLED